MAPWLKTMASWAARASNLFGAVVKGRPVISAISAGDLLGEADGGVQAGADGGAALRQFHQGRQRLLDALDAVLDLLGIAAELLAQRQRRGVLGMGAADLDDVAPGLGLGVQRGVQMFQGRDQVVDHLFGAGDVHGRGIGVVGRLAHIDVVVGVDRLLGAHLAAQNLDRAIRDHLIGVHVRLGARTRLPDHQREVVVQLAFDHLIGGLDDGVGQGRRPACPGRGWSRRPPA
jgi:hypothetical protein